MVSKQAKLLQSGGGGRLQWFLERSGKIMRRIMRKILAGEEDQLGDITTLSDPSVVDKIIDIVHQSKKK